MGRGAPGPRKGHAGGVCDPFFFPAAARGSSAKLELWEAQPHRTSICARSSSSSSFYKTRKEELFLLLLCLTPRFWSSNLCRQQLIPPSLPTPLATRTTSTNTTIIHTIMSEKMDMALGDIIRSGQAGFKVLFCFPCPSE